MAIAPKPDIRPANANFSSGPCAKRPGFTLDALSDAVLGRSHRAKEPKARLADVIERSRAMLGMPADWRLGIVPASDTGAVEMALWSLLGARPVDILAFESFGEGWATDVVKQLRLADARVLSAPYGRLPDLAAVDFSHDVVFPWNGTTSGVRVPNGDWIARDRVGLTICDATSAAFAMALPWDRLDVVTWSWQKVLGGEAAHGMLALSPHAVARLETYKPAWPLPKIFRLTSGGKLIEAIFKGETIEHTLDAVRRGRAGRAALGGIGRRTGRADCTVGSQSRGDCAMGGADGVGGFPGRGRWDALLHVDLSDAGGPGGSKAVSRAAGEGRRRLRHRCVSRCTAWPAHLGWCDHRHGGRREAAAMARLGLRRGRGGATEGSGIAA